MQMLRADQTEMNRNRRTTFGGAPFFFPFQPLLFQLHKISISMLLPSRFFCVYFFFHLPMRLQVWNDWNKLFHLNGKFPKFATGESFGMKSAPGVFYGSKIMFS